MTDEERNELEARRHALIAELNEVEDSLGMKRSIPSKHKPDLGQLTITGFGPCEPPDRVVFVPMYPPMAMQK